MGKIGYLREKKGKKKYLFNFNFFNMAGRGRGRGALLIKAQDKLPGGLPGHPLVKKQPVTTSTLEGVQKALQSLSVDEEDDVMNSIIEQIKQKATTANDLDSVLDLMYKRCEQEYELAAAIGKCCEQLATYTVENKSFRAVLLRSLHNQSKDPSIRLSNNKRYLAYCSLLCQIYVHVKTAPGKHLAVLETPVCTVLENLLDDNASDLEVEVAATQISNVLSILRKSENKQLTVIKSKLRNKIINRQGSPELRKRLISTLELLALVT